MTIENLIQSRIDRIFLLDGFLRELHLCRRTKESAMARKVRRNLINEIKEMVAWECDELVDDEDYLDGTTESERAQDESVLPGWCATMDDFSTVFDTVALLDSAPLLTDEGRAFDPSMGRWYAVEEGYPKKMSVSADELGNLAALIKRIEEALDISFTVERFFWTEDQLAMWTLAQEERDAQPG